jgi:hypothetical protein
MNLHLLLEGPFVLCDDNDKFRVLIPDLMDTHFKPGITATNNALELENGMWTIDLGDPIDDGEEEETEPYSGETFKFDEISDFSRPRTCRSYAVLTFTRRPDYYVGISPHTAEIWFSEQTSYGLRSVQAPPEGPSDFATRAVLVFESVDLENVRVDPESKWGPSGNQPDIVSIGGVGLLVLDMKPITVPSTEDHAQMAYRNMARMVGLDRYMQHPPVTHLGRYNDCGAIMMHIKAPKV